MIKLKWSPFIPETIKPTPKQAAFLLLSPFKEALFGGSAGGGKSEALLLGALQYTDCPKYAGILFRRTITDLKLPDSILSRAKDWLGPYVNQRIIKWASDENTFYFPSGASLTFGYMDKANDRYRYKSAQFQYIGIDECTDIDEEDYLYMFSRLRRTVDMDIPLRFRAGTNPGGRSHQFIKERFGIKRSLESGKFVGTVKKKPFIPCFAYENPYLDEGYYENLSELGSVERKRLQEGDWDSQELSVYDKQWFDNRYTIKNQDVIVLHEGNTYRTYRLRDLLRFQCVDSASSEKTGIEGKSFRENRPPAWSVCGTFALIPDPPFDLIWLHNFRSQCKIPEFKDKVKTFFRKWEPLFVRIQDTTADRGLHQSLSAEGVPVKPVSDPKDKVSTSIPAQIRAERGRIWLPAKASWLEDLENELFAWTGSPREVDDQIDVLSSAGQEAALRGLGEEVDSTIKDPAKHTAPSVVGATPRMCL